MVWLKFVLSLLIILFAGTKLARYGDCIAEKTGVGRIWIGLVLLAFVTSMPELVTGVSAAALVKGNGPDLAVGTFLGSCLYNLSILALLDVLHHRSPVLSNVSGRHITSAGLGIVLIALTAGGILFQQRFSGFSLGWVGVSSIVVPLSYLGGARMMFLSDRKQAANAVQTESPIALYEGISTKTIFLRFILAALTVAGAGIWLSFLGDEIAETTGWDASFVGSLFLAITTSMPELVVTITAVRLGATDMAVADILGANMLDIVAVTWADLVYTEGPILAAISRIHLVTAMIIVLMSLLVIIGVRFQQRRKTFVFISWYVPLLIGLYIFGAYALFANGIGMG